MEVSHVHCRVRDLSAASRWFEQVLQATPVFNNERMVWLGFGDFGVILDAAPAGSVLTLGFDSDDLLPPRGTGRLSDWCRNLAP